MAKNNEKLSIENNNGVIAGNVDNLHISYSNSIKLSILASILKCMIDDDALNTPPSKKLLPYDIDDKILFNNVIKYKEIINDYSGFCKICEETINKLDNIKPNTKSKILRSVHNKYLLIKGDYLKNKDSFEKEIEIVRKNADSILDKIKECYIEQVLKTDLLMKYPYEDLELNLTAFIVYCFVECEILERPPQEKKYDCKL